METDCNSLRQTISELDRIDPTAPFLALGQTLFWDEPMKAGLAVRSKQLGSKREFVAGVHDTDYFAKLPSQKQGKQKFKAVPHNDTTTKSLWSAAAEFSALFGSETVITKDSLASGGLRLGKIQAVRPNILDELTEAWGWRGVVALSEDAPITAEVMIRTVLPELMGTFDWAVDLSIDCIAQNDQSKARSKMDSFRELLCESIDRIEPNSSLSDYYRHLLPKVYDFVAGEQTGITASATTELLKFNTNTWSKPRFEIVQKFLAPETSELAKDAYNQAIQGSEIYPLTRFGTGAIPFDLVIPGVGRGTIRLGTRGAVIATPTPQFLSFKKPPQGLEELAKAITDKFGPNCTLVGKAVTLIGMLAREFVFVFHEGASSYVHRSKRLHDSLDFKVLPILRIRYQAWDAMQASCSWLKLPDPLQHAFGTEDTCSPSFAARWRCVGSEQEAILAELGQLKRPIDLIHYLEKKIGGGWSQLASEYGQLHDQIGSVKAKVDQIKLQRVGLYSLLRERVKNRTETEIAKGQHFREHIFEKKHTEADLHERERLTKIVEDAIHQIAEVRTQINTLLRAQAEAAASDEALAIHERRRAIELEAELKRAKLIRSAIISSRGLKASNHRPSAWWMPLACPDGKWFQKTIDTAEFYLEPLSR